MNIILVIFMSIIPSNIRVSFLFDKIGKSVFNYWPADAVFSNESDYIPTAKVLAIFRRFLFHILFK